MDAADEIAPTEGPVVVAQEVGDDGTLDCDGRGHELVDAESQQQGKNPEIDYHARRANQAKLDEDLGTLEADPRSAAEELQDVFEPEFGLADGAVDKMDW